MAKKRSVRRVVRRTAVSTERVRVVRSGAKQRQVLVLGATGQLGSELLRQFGADEVLFKTHEALDLTRLLQVRDNLAMLKPDLVINTVAITGEARCEQDRLQAWQVNTQAVDNLVKSCALQGVPLIQLSDSVVFGQAEPRIGGFLELDPICPRSWYAQTKAAGEQAVLGLSQCVRPEFWNHGFRYWLIRTSGLFERHAGRPRTELAHVLSQLRTRSRSPHPVPVARDVYRSFTYVPHLAQALVWLARNYKEVVSGVWHIANAGQCSCYEFLSQAALALGLDADLLRPTAVEDMTSVYGVSRAFEVARFATLNCSRWGEISPFRLPTWQEAMDAFAAASR